MDIETLTIGEARAIARLFTGQQQQSEHPYKIGAIYFIRTVTHHYTGRLNRVGPLELVLTDAAWIADDGRFSDALKSGEFSEVEPYPDGEVIIGRGAILDACIVDKLQRSKK
jgi:hypothetical protein